MGKTLAELLADAASGDDLAFTGPDGMSFKLADLRGLHKGTEAEIKAKREEAIAAATEAAKILKALQDAQKEIDAAAAKGVKKTEPDKAPDWKADALYAPLVPVFDSLEKQVKDSIGVIKALQSQLTQNSAFYVMERLRSEYNAAPENFRKANAFEKIVAEALKAGEVDSFGEGENAVKMPTLRKRIHEATEEDRITARVAAEVAKAEEKWKKEAALAAVPKPGRFQTRVKSDKAPIAKLDDLNSEAVAKAAAEDKDFADAIAPMIQ